MWYKVDHRCKVNIVPAYVLVPSRNKPLPESKFPKYIKSVIIHDHTVNDLIKKSSIYSSIIFFYEAAYDP